MPFQDPQYGQPTYSVPRYGQSQYTGNQFAPSQYGQYGQTGYPVSENSIRQIQSQVQELRRNLESLSQAANQLAQVEFSNRNRLSQLESSENNTARQLQQLAQNEANASQQLNEFQHMCNQVSQQLQQISAISQRLLPGSRTDFR